MQGMRRRQPPGIMEARLGERTQGRIRKRPLLTTWQFEIFEVRLDTSARVGKIVTP